MNVQAVAQHLCIVPCDHALLTMIGGLTSVFEIRSFALQYCNTSPEIYIAFWTCTVYSNEIPIIRMYKKYLRGLNRTQCTPHQLLHM